MNYKFLDANEYDPTAEVSYECRDCDTWFEEPVSECDCCGSNNIKSYTNLDILDAKYERSFDE